MTLSGPSVSRPDPRDHTPRHSILLTDQRQGASVTPDGLHLFKGELGLGVPGPLCLALLGLHVIHVGLPSVSPKVTGINTARIITAVQDMEPVGYGAMCKQVAGTTGLLRQGEPAPCAKVGIPITIDGPLPSPAFIETLDNYFTPEEIHVILLKISLYHVIPSSSTGALS